MMRRSMRRGMVRLLVLVGAATNLLCRLCDALTNVTLPPPDANGGLYVINVQTSYPAANWSDVDRLYIPAGNYTYMRIGNLPNRCGDNQKPLIITNLGGQVRVGGLGFYYVMSISGGCNWKLTGKYDPAEETGDINYPGHADGAYANSQGTYGILVDDAYSACEDGQEGCPYNLTTCASTNCPNKATGLTISSNAPASQPQPPTSDFEISYVEIRDTGFAGLSAKTDNNQNLPCSPEAGKLCSSMTNYTMRNVKIHDLYIHDVLSEGMYLGSTQNSAAQHSFENLRVYNNRVLRTGTEGIQAGQLGDGCEISNNVVALPAIDWKDAFQAFQDNSLQLAPRYGNISVHHNIFIGAADSLVSMRKMNALGDTHNVGDRVELHNNYFSSARFLGIFMGVDYQPKINETDILFDNLTSFLVSNSTFRNFEFQKTEIYDYPPNANEDVIRVLNLPNEIFLTDNELNQELGLNRLKLAKWPYSNWLDLNGFSGLTSNSSRWPYGSINATGNVRIVVPPVKFQNFMPLVDPDVDYLLFERWSCNASLAQGNPIEYFESDYVIHKQRLFKAKLNHTCIEPGNTTYWEFVSDPVDDVRLACDGIAKYHGVGLLDVATCTSQPSGMPSVVPSGVPSGEPSIVPSGAPSIEPSGAPCGEPSLQPSSSPSSTLTSDSCHKDAKCTTGCYVCCRKCFKVKRRTLRSKKSNAASPKRPKHGPGEFEYECKHSLKCKDDIDRHDNIFERRICSSDVFNAHCFYEGDPCSITGCADANICV